MKLSSLTNALRNMSNATARDPSLGPREVKDKVLDGLERQWQAKMNEDRKQQLREMLKQRERQEAARVLDDGINPLRYNGVGMKIGPVPRQQGTFQRGYMLRKR